VLNATPKADNIGIYKKVERHEILHLNTRKVELMARGTFTRFQQKNQGQLHKTGINAGRNYQGKARREGEERQHT
jgi:hypothetical protein